MSYKSSSSYSPFDKGTITLKHTNHYKDKFARKFLRSLMIIKRKKYSHYNQNSPNNKNNIREIQKKIKLAAYSSMARAIGPRKAWTRALLYKRLLKMKMKQKKRIKIKNIINMKRKSSRDLDQKMDDKTEKLREIVPGGKEMDVYSLFEETAHYIKCLSIQVQVMKDIADHFSN